jgi:hypothetical protein
MSLIWHNKNVQNLFFIMHRSKNCLQKFTWEALSCSFCLWVPAFYTDETSSLHAKFFEGTCLTSIQQLCACLVGCLTLLHYCSHSVFSVVWMECAGPTDLFTELSWILKLSTCFKMALSKGILCIATLDFHWKCVVSEEVLTAKTYDSLSSSPWLLNCILRCICMHAALCSNYNQLPTIAMWNVSHIHGSLCK